MLDSSIYIRQIPLYIRWIQTGYNHTARTTGCLGCTPYSIAIYAVILGQKIYGKHIYVAATL